MRSLRAVAGTLVPLLVTAECVPALEYRNGAWGAPPEQSHYHVPEQTRGEFSFTIDAPAISGTNSTATVVSYDFPDSSWFSVVSFDDSWPSPTIIVAPREGKTKRVARVVVASFPALQYGPRHYAFVSAAHPRPVTVPNMKRFLFRRP
jgi:hypothetical protein